MENQKTLAQLQKTAGDLKGTQGKKPKPLRVENPDNFLGDGWYCRSGKHFWLNKSDAEKCCNGYRRSLVLDDSRRVVNINGTFARKWTKIEGESE